MIPTVLGVIIITFILFNIVGGSPALMTLGKHVSPQALEEFDELRGFNKPLLFGRYTETRALDDTGFNLNAGAWNVVDGVAYDDADGGYLRLPASTNAYDIPLAFALRPETGYRWIIEYRLPSGSASFAWSAGQERHVESFEPAGAWKTIKIDTVMDATPADLRAAFEVKEGHLEIGSMSLRRRVRNPFDSQFVYYLGQLLRFDFGVSSVTNQRVSRLLLDGIPASLMLTVPIFLVGLSVSIGLSLICAFFKDRAVDRGFVLIAVVLMSVNYLVYIIAGQYLFAYKLGWFPIWGFESWQYLVLPVTIGVISGLGMNLRFYRTIMLDEMYKDYVRTAFAKGVSNRGVLLKHVLKNAMIPIVTNVVIALPFLYTGSLLLESFFGIPGLGFLGVQAIMSSDVDVVRALVFIGAVLYVVANLLTDICYAWVDPRVQLQ
jgi:peptide/nickel transport system permease protein